MTAWPTWRWCAPSRNCSATVASDPTVSRLIATLAAEPRPRWQRCVRPAPRCRERAWLLDLPVPADGADHRRPGRHDRARRHSEKEGAAPTWKRGFGFHPLLAFVDHGPGGTGEPVAALLRAGNAGANNAADHILVLDEALAQLPAAETGRVLVRGDTGAGVKDFVHHVHGLGLRYSVGIGARAPIVDALPGWPRQAWRAAVDLDGEPRDGAQVAELTRWLPTMTGWPPGCGSSSAGNDPTPARSCA